MIPARRASDPETFAALLDVVRARVDAALAAWLAPKVEAAGRIGAETAAAARAVERLAIRGGKRMRAALVAAAYEGCGGAGDGAIAGMLAVELLQVYLLVHDDWMDDDDVRRGGPAVHVELRGVLGSRKLGDACGVLAGDLASSYAQEALLESDAPAAHVLRAARVFAKIQEDVVSGQIAEMTAGSVASARAPSVEQIYALKTASYTVTGPLALGAALAGADEARVADVARFGRPLGVAFQLRDDLLGVFGDPTATGKPVWNDLRQGKRTALVAALEGDANGDALLRRVLGRADASDVDLEAVVRAMETSGARGRVEARLRGLCEEARGVLASMPLEGRARAWLEGAVAALGERSS